MASQLRRYTADTLVGSAYLKSVSLLGGSAASSVAIKEGGSAGSVLLTLDAAIDTPQSWRASDPAGAMVADLYVDLTGTGAEVTLELEPA